MKKEIMEGRTKGREEERTTANTKERLHGREKKTQRRNAINKLRNNKERKHVKKCQEGRSEGGGERTEFITGERRTRMKTDRNK